jgi:hypothetical protein
MHRYIYNAVTLQLGDSSTEFWLGVESPERLDLAEYPDFIPADGMSEAELSVVQGWTTL